MTVLHRLYIMLGMLAVGITVLVTYTLNTWYTDQARYQTSELRHAVAALTALTATDVQNPDPAVRTGLPLTSDWSAWPTTAQIHLQILRSGQPLYEQGNREILSALRGYWHEHHSQIANDQLFPLTHDGTEFVALTGISGENQLRIMAIQADAGTPPALQRRALIASALALTLLASLWGLALMIRHGLHAAPRLLANDILALSDDAAPGHAVLQRQPDGFNPIRIAVKNLVHGWQAAVRLPPLEEKTTAPHANPAPHIVSAADDSDGAAARFEAIRGAVQDFDAAAADYLSERAARHTAAETERVHARETAEAAEMAFQTLTDALQDLQDTPQSNTIADLSQHIQDAQPALLQARENLEQTEDQINRLQEAVSEINRVAKEIHAVTHRTNILAMNATIEAAHAGEAGVGFAVVANEVKQLAGETAAATSGIAQYVQTLHSESAHTADSLLAVREALDKVNAHEAALLTLCRRDTEGPTKGTAMGTAMGPTSATVETAAAAAARMHDLVTKLDDGESAQKRLEHGNDTLTLAWEAARNRMLAEIETSPSADAAPAGSEKLTA